MSKWDQYDLHHELVRKLQSIYPSPTEIQHHSAQSFPNYTEFILASQTGTGKTLAFGIPIISDILKYKQQDENYIRALILSPTRELSLQIQQHLDKINDKQTIKIVNLVGGLSKQKQERLLSKGVDILIATPGRLWDMIESKECPILQHLDLIDFLVLDEADRMVELGHFKELNKILNKVQKSSGFESYDDEIKQLYESQQPSFELKRSSKDQVKLNSEILDQIGMDEVVMLDSNQNVIPMNIPQFECIKNTNRKRKIFLVSATLLKAYRGQKFQVKIEKVFCIKQKKSKKKRLRNQESNEDEMNLKMQALMQKLKFQGKPKIIDLTSQNMFPELLQEYKSIVVEEDKFLYLYNYIKQRQGESFIIFNNSVTYANKVSQVLKVLGLKGKCLKKSVFYIPYNNKDKDQKNKQYDIIVCTDIAARGLDIPNIENVVHFQVPIDIDTYIHRSGRTARNGSVGSSYALVGPKDQSKYLQLCKQLNRETGIKNIEMKIEHTMSNQFIKGNMVLNALNFESTQHQMTKKKSQENWYNYNLGLSNKQTKEILFWMMIFKVKLIRSKNK